ncbi:hypothetical protein NDU88_005740 [Pleurodeles waltl]|uniref:Uncharacterized protein n=1 Tax=Pleurodeles waltl TaxID=8319 RepID=A0AAV7RJY6_PLEWA|nr:hypothetical protein NDU88_005740 [Pleurodeles waltl]
MPQDVTLSLQGLRRTPPHASQLGCPSPKPAATQTPQAQQHDKPPTRSPSPAASPETKHCSPREGPSLLPSPPVGRPSCRGSDRPLLHSRGRWPLNSPKSARLQVRGQGIHITAAPPSPLCPPPACNASHVAQHRPRTFTRAPPQKQHQRAQRKGIQSRPGPPDILPIQKNSSYGPRVPQDRSMISPETGAH